MHTDVSGDPDIYIDAMIAESYIYNDGVPDDACITSCISCDSHESISISIYHRNVTSRNRCTWTPSCHWFIYIDLIVALIHLFLFFDIIKYSR